MSVKRSRNANGYEIAFGDTGIISRSFQHSILNELLEIFLHNIADVVFATVYHVDLVLHDVETDRFESCFRFFDRKWQAYVA